MLGITYKIIKNGKPVDIIPLKTATSAMQEKKQQLYDNILNKFKYPNETTTTVVANNNYNYYNVWNPTTTNNI
jgi:hypothetical protein